jgi:hypothetical protein
MLADYLLLLVRQKNEDSARVIWITKGREYLTTDSKIRVTHVRSFDCFGKTERDFSELLRSHFFIRKGSSSQ